MFHKTFTDVENDIFIEQDAIGPNDVGGDQGNYLVTKRTLRGGLRDGVDVIEVNNGTFRFTVVPTRGMGIWQAHIDDTVLGWTSPVQGGPVHPSFVPIFEPSGIGWLSGFDELLCRCGLESNGAPEFNENGTVKYPLHGKIANTPAHKVDVSIDGDSGEISVTGVVDESRLFGNKLRLTSTASTKVDRPGMTITDEITNLSAEACELQLLYHTNVGTPFLDPGSKLVVPVEKMAPRDEVAVGNIAQWDTYGPESPGTPEACFFYELAADGHDRTAALLHNSAGDKGVSLSFSKKQLPYFIQWKNRQGAADGYVTGLEPAINFPNIKSFEKEKGRVAVLAPGETRKFEIVLQAHPTAASVDSVKQTIAKLQENTSRELLPQPEPQWSNL